MKKILIVEDDVDIHNLIKDILKKKSSIESAVSYAEKQFAPYSDYI